jgi:hypothetical protein
MKTTRMKLVGSYTSEFLTVYGRRRLNNISNPLSELGMLL